MLQIIKADAEEHMPQVRVLFQEYADTLGVDLCFQGFDQELATLPGDYAPPSGRLFLALHENGTVGCAALRKLEDDVCEMKRLYTRPGYRGLGTGRALATAVIDEAKSIGYRHMRLDTLPWMNEAIALYRSLGFSEIPAYRENPVPDTVYLELDLG
jgi:GNAT superfamily N-acetyltransferase